MAQAGVATAIALGEIIDGNDTDTKIKPKYAEAKEVEKDVNTPDKTVKKKKKKDKKCSFKRVVSKIKGLITLLVMPVVSIFGFFDLITDANLLYKIQQDPALIFISILMSLSILAPYLICYASCTRLYLNGGVFDNINNKSIGIKILFFIYFLPIGLFYYILLDIYLLISNLLISIISLLFCDLFNKQTIKFKKFRSAELIGMSYMNVEGYKRMRSIAQLIMESCPQFTIQVLLFVRVISLDNTTVETKDILVSLASTICNVTYQVGRTKLESMAVGESFLSYLSECYIGRFVWVPFINDIVGVKWMKHDKTQIISLSNIKSKVLCFPSMHIEYYFSDITMRKLIDHLVEVSATIHVKKDDMQQLLLGDSYQFCSIQSVIQLIFSCKNKTVINDIDDIDWEKCRKASQVLGEGNTAKAPNGDLLLKLLILGLNNRHYKRKTVINTFRKIIETGISLDEQDVFGDTISHWLIKRDGDEGYGGDDDDKDTNKINQNEDEEDHLESWHAEEVKDPDNPDDLEDYASSETLYYDLLEVIISSAKQKPNLSHLYNLSQYSAIMDVIDKYSANDVKIYDLLRTNNYFGSLIKINDICHFEGEKMSFIGFCFKRKLIDVVRFLCKECQNDINSDIRQEIILPIVEYILYWMHNKNDIELRDLNVLQELESICQLFDIDLIDIKDTSHNNILNLFVLRYQGQSTVFKKMMLQLIEQINDTDVIFAKNQKGHHFVHSIILNRHPDTLWNIDEKNIGKHFHDYIVSNRELWMDDMFRDLFVEFYYNRFKNDSVDYNVFYYSTGWNKYSAPYTWIFKNECVRNKKDESVITKLFEDTGKKKTDMQRKELAAVLVKIGFGYDDQEQEKTGMTTDELDAFFREKMQESQTKSSDKDEEDEKNKADDDEDSDDEESEDDEHKFDGVSLKEYTVETTTSPHLYAILPLMDSSVDENVRNEAVKEHALSRDMLNSYEKEGDELNLINPFEHLSSKYLQKNVTTREDEAQAFRDGLLYQIMILFVEVLSLCDFITDCIILRKFIMFSHVWWSSFSILMMLAPYIISFSSLLFLFKTRRRFKGLFGTLYLTPFGILYFILVDIFFIVYTLFASVLSLVSCGRLCANSSDLFEYFLSKIIGLSAMDIRGYRRLRTIAQITFESIPQIALQLRILFAVQDSKDLRLDEYELISSLIFALAHLCIETIILYYESKACKMNMMHYGALCLDGRSGFVPFIHLFSRPQDEQQTELDFDLKCTTLLKNVMFKMYYEFTQDTFNNLLASITYLSENKNCVPYTFVMHGYQCNKNLDLFDLTSLYTLSLNKFEIRTSKIDYNELFLNAAISKDKLPELRDKYGENQLFTSISLNMPQMAKVLIRNGMDVNAAPIVSTSSYIVAESIDKKMGDVLSILLQRKLQILNKYESDDYDIGGIIRNRKNISLFHALILNNNFLFLRTFSCVNFLQLVEAEYYQGGGWHPFNFCCSFGMDGVMMGCGADGIGPFTVNGNIDWDQHKMHFDKRYERHSCVYRGNINETNHCDVTGTWSIKSIQSNMFRMKLRSDLYEKYCGGGGGGNDSSDNKLFLRGIWYEIVRKLNRDASLIDGYDMKWAKKVLQCIGYYQFDYKGEIERIAAAEDDADVSYATTNLMQIYDEIAYLRRSFSIKLRDDATETIRVCYETLSQFSIFKEYIRFYANNKEEEEEEVVISLSLYNVESLRILQHVFNAFEFGFVAQQLTQHDLIHMDDAAVALNWYRNIGNYVCATADYRGAPQNFVAQVVFDETQILDENGGKSNLYPAECEWHVPPNFLSCAKMKLEAQCCDQNSWITSLIFNNYFSIQVIRNGVVMGQIVMIHVDSNKKQQQSDDEFWTWKASKRASKNDAELNSICANDLLRVRVYSYAKDPWLLKVKSIKLSVAFYTIAAVAAAGKEKKRKETNTQIVYQ
eukprot:24552_1